LKTSQHLSYQDRKLYQNERIELITNILKQRGYATVKELVQTLRYSNATVNRDLNVMEKRGVVKRSYGGAELVGVLEKLKIRYQKMKPEKMRLAKRAAQFVSDGDTIFIDASTTAEYMAQYLLEKKDLTVISNNMALVSFLSEFSVNCVCLGGRVIEKPYMLCDENTVLNARRYHADKMFFSTGGVSPSGSIAFGGDYCLLLQTMMDNSDKVFFMADKDKIRENHSIKRFEELDCVIVDFPIDQAVKDRCPHTDIIEI